MREWSDKERILDVVLTNISNDKVKARIKLDNVSRLIAIPELSDVITPIATTTIKSLSNVDHLQIEDQTYIGTIKSSITDSVVDIYYISREYEVTVPTISTATESFFLIIPSTVFLGKYGMMPKDGPIEILGVVSGVDDLLYSTDGFDTSIVALDKDVNISTYLTDEIIDFEEAKVYLNSYILPGLTTDNLITSVRSNDGNSTLVGKYGATQLLILENASALFPDADELLVGSIKQTFFNRFKIGNRVRHKVDKYNLAIPLNF